MIMPLARPVAGDDRDRRRARGDRAELRNRQLVLGQHLEQERVERLVSAVDLADQQHRRARPRQRLPQRTPDQPAARREAPAEHKASDERQTPSARRNEVGAPEVRKRQCEAAEILEPAGDAEAAIRHQEQRERDGGNRRAGEGPVDGERVVEDEMHGIRPRQIWSVSIVTQRYSRT
jgi:hypothetical protein